MRNFASEIKHTRMQQEEITLQTLTDSEDINIGYSDNDIVVVDSIQQFTEIDRKSVV